MVLGICRHILNEEHDAEDAFQATFLVLAQKGGSIRNRRVLAGWLHEVAHRIAVKARVSVVRRRTLERQAMAMSPAPIEPNQQDEARRRGMSCVPCCTTRWTGYRRSIVCR